MSIRYHTAKRHLCKYPSQTSQGLLFCITNLYILYGMRQIATSQRGNEMPAKIQHYREMSEFAYGVVDQMTPLIRRVICKNPMPFTYKGTGTYIVGTGKVAVIDPGPALSSHVDDVLAALGPDEEVTHILITHTHSDHSTLAARMQELTGAPSYGFGPHGEVRRFDPDDKVDFSKYFTTEEKARFDKEWDELPDEIKREGPDLDFVPDIRIADGDVIEGDGWTLTAVHTPLALLEPHLLPPGRGKFAVFR